MVPDRRTQQINYHFLMKIKTLLIILVILVAIAAAFFAFNNYIYEQKQGYAARNYKDAEFILEGERIRLGTDAQYFGNELKTDLNDDGREDVVFLITQSKGGSGTFYYVVAALNTERGYVGSYGLFLGDRIAPQTTEKGKGKIVVVNYADRAPTDPFTTAPSIGKSIWLLLDPQSMQFGEVVKDFEGEANPAIMTLDMKKWVWSSTLTNDGMETIPRQSFKFTITFGKDGRFSATTDCNSASGTYTASNGLITFGPIAQTKMFCEGSLESVFIGSLQNASGYHFTSKGELILDLKFDSGSVVFK